MDATKKILFAVLVLAVTLADVHAVNAANAMVSNQQGQNLVTYSEQFDHTAWTTSGLAITVTPNATAAPDGTMTAERIAATAVNNYHFLSRSLSSIVIGRTYTFSVYAKAGTSHFVYMGDNGVNYVAWFDLSNGTTGNITGNPTKKIVPVGGGWYRCSITYVAAATTVTIYIPRPDNGTLVWTGDGTYLNIWGAQIVLGQQPAAYQKVTAAVFGPTYTPLGAMVSNQLGQNLLLRSEQMDHAIWATTAGVTVTTNNVAAPDGTMTAEKMDFTGGDTSYRLQTVTGLKGGEPYTFSVWLYTQTKIKIAIVIRGTTSNTPLLGTAVTLTPGWKRYSFTTTLASNDTGAYVGFENRSFAGSDTLAGILYAWGVQLVHGRTPGAYNKTDATAIRATLIPSGATVSRQLGQNLITLSEKISSWTLGGGVAVTANAALAPDGTMTADKINFTSDTQYVLAAAATIPNKAVGTKYTFSIWLWTDTKTNIGIRTFSSPGDNILEAHRTVTLTQTPTRYFITSPVIASGSDNAVVLDIENRLVYGSDGGSGAVYAWGAQIVAGDKMGAYNKTDATAKNPTYLP